MDYNPKFFNDEEIFYDLEQPYDFAGFNFEVVVITWAC